METCDATCSLLKLPLSLLNLGLLLSVSLFQLKILYVITDNTSVNKGKRFIVCWCLFFINNVNSLVLLTDHSQPSHAVHLLCIRRRPCECTSPCRSLLCLAFSGVCLFQIVSCSVFSKDTTDFVAYVAKDPVNRRGILPSCSVISRFLTVICLRPARHSCFLPSACHILECSDGLAQDVISTIGQAFDLRFQQYLQCPSSKISSSHDR